MPNELILSASQHLEAPPPARLTLASVQVSAYQQIRILALCRSVSEGAVEVVLTHVEGQAGVAPLDRYVLAPGVQVNQVYPVPGVILSLDVAPAADAPADVDVLIWGFRNGEAYPGIDPNVAPKVEGTLRVSAFLDGGNGEPGESAGADVVVTLDGTYMGITDESGSVSFDRIEGDYVLEARSPEDLTSGLMLATIVGDQITELTVVLGPEGGDRTPKDGAPPEGRETPGGSRRRGGRTGGRARRP